MLRRSICVAVICMLAGVAPSPAQDLTGCWQGRWQDCKSGHSGPLKGTFTACGDNAYDVVFTGRFAGIMPFRFRTTLNVVERDGNRVRLSGSSNLGLFGTFTYDAEATDTCFHATFCSRRYNGEFNLSR